jgi:hypothetical protein
MQVNSPIKLRARDVDDMQVLSSCLQDALVGVGDIAYLKPEKRFVLVANRFMWENGPQDPPAPESPEDPADARFEDQDAGPLYERSYCGLCFDRVKQVRYQGLVPSHRDQILSLLTIEATPREVTLVFSGGAAIRLEVGAIACHLEDLGEPWPTRWRPAHEAAGEAARDHTKSR